jgi:hypothetical protein
MGKKITIRDERSVAPDEINLILGSPFCRQGAGVLCGGWDSNPRTPKGRGPEPRAVDQAGRPPLGRGHPRALFNGFPGNRDHPVSVGLPSLACPIKRMTSRVPPLRCSILPETGSIHRSSALSSPLSLVGGALLRVRVFSSWETSHHPHSPDFPFAGQDPSLASNGSTSHWNQLGIV